MRLFSDQQNLLLDVTFQGAGASIGPAAANEAVAQAYRNIGSALSWSYLRRRTQINTVAPYSTGTIAYTASTRTLTLTGGTWPTWAVTGLVLINTQAYAVQTRSSGTVLLLTADRCPVADIVAGTVFTITQIEYVLPENFVRVEELVQMGTVWRLQPMQYASTLELTRLFYNPTRPFEYLIRGSTYYGGRMAIEYGPPPDAAYTYDLSYYSQPRKRTLGNKYETGTVSVVGTAVTGVGTTFTQSMVGCQLRQGTAASVPIGEYGEFGSTNENSILSVTDATHLVLADAGATLGAVKFTIDDPIDIERGSMDEVFCRMCEYQFAIVTRQNNREEKRREMVSALVNARSMDARLSPRNQAWYVPTLEELAYANLGGR